MPKGRQRKIKGAICNVPVKCDETCKVLPRPPERSGIIMLKLKRKLQFRGHVYYEPVRPEFISCALNWLKVNNPLYSDIAVDMHNIHLNLVSMQQNMSDENHTVLDSEIDEASNNEEPINIENNIQSEEEDMTTEGDIPNDNEEKDDPLNKDRTPTIETCLQSVIPDYPAYCKRIMVKHH